MLDMRMLYAIRLGPIETGEGPTTAYVGFTEAGALPPILASSDKDGLRELARQAQGHELRCERALLRAGKALGFASGAAAGPGSRRAGDPRLRPGWSWSEQGPQSRHRRKPPGEHSGLLPGGTLALLVRQRSASVTISSKETAPISSLWRSARPPPLCRSDPTSVQPRHTGSADQSSGRNDPAFAGGNLGVARARRYIPEGSEVSPCACVPARSAS